MRARTQTLALAALVLAAGLLSWALFGTSPGEEEPSLDGGPLPNEPPNRAGTARSEGDRPQVLPPAVPGEDPSADVPRLLPPDAAVEDIRDALALADVKERDAALRAAWRGLGQLVTDGGPPLRAVRALLAKEEDPDLRAVASAAVLITLEGRPRSWYRSLPEADRRTILAAALAEEGLPPIVRAALEAAR